MRGFYVFLNTIRYLFNFLKADNVNLPKLHCFVLEYGYWHLGASK